MHPCHTHRHASQHCSLHSCTHMHNCQEHNHACMHSCALNRRASNAHLFSPFRAPPCMISQLQLCTHAHESFDRPRTGGATLTKSPCTTIRTTLPKKEILITMQEDMTTNLALTDPESAGSISQNLQISSETSHPLTKTTGTNEVALWALQLYIVPLPNFQDQLQELRSSIFRSIFSHGIRIPPPTQSHPPGHHPSSAPEDAFFSHPAQVRLLIFTSY
jgi:hypothetical protein